MSKWKFDCWNGYYMDIDDNKRVWRHGMAGGYEAEFWGDFSFEYPVRTFFASLKKAKEWLMKQKV